MSRKFSAQGLLRTEITKLIDDTTNSVPTENREALKRIVTELDEITVKDTLNDIRDPVKGPGFDLVITTEFIETNMDQSRTVDLYLEVYDIIKDYFVSKSLYWWMEY